MLNVGTLHDKICCAFNTPSKELSGEVVETPALHDKRNRHSGLDTCRPIVVGVVMLIRQFQLLSNCLQNAVVSG